MKYITLNRVFTDTIVPTRVNLSRIILWSKKLNLSEYRDWKAGIPISKLTITGASACITIDVTESVEEIDQLIKEA